MMDERELRVSTLEAFFDLVFVFAITQLTSLIEHDLSLRGVARAALVFVVLSWMYGGYAWLTNQVPPTTTPRRLLLVCGMAAFLICALAIPRAFDQAAFAFAIGYLLVVVVHSGLYAETHGASVWRFVPVNFLGAACLVGAAFVDGWARYGLWAATLALHYATTYLAGRVGESQGAGYAVRADHFVERHGLVLLIAFGESVVAIGIALAEADPTPEIYGAATLGLALAAALWWVPSSTIDLGRRRRSSRRHSRHACAWRSRAISTPTSPSSSASWCSPPGSAARCATSRRRSPWSTRCSWGGTALYLLGTMAFRLVFGIRPAATRLIAASAAVATAFAGIAVSAFVQVGLLIATVVGLIAVESRASVEGR